MQVLYQLSYGPNASRRPWPSLRRVEAYNVTPPMALPLTPAATQQPIFLAPAPDRQAPRSGHTQG
ncbi:hypothetical protein WH7805_05201 [Synechococcus sp. WH 7805]|nr:hypothetical protein WH7805_05201 [Synechococcus sp. WH 7805]